MKERIVLFVTLFVALTVSAQNEVKKGLDAITEESVKGQLEFLASDWTEGRAVGTRGEYMAADYIASMLKTYGVKPFGDEVLSRPSRREMTAGVRPKVSRSYYQNFSLIQYESGEEQSLSLVFSGTGSENALNFGHQTDFYVRTGTVGQTAQAPLVFVGYGFEDENAGYSDLKKINLKGKIAVVLLGYPGCRDSSSVAFEKCAPKDRWAAYMLERNKTKRLEKAGAIAIIQVNTVEDPTLAWAQNQIYPVKGTYYESDKPLGSYYNTRMALPGDTLTSNIPVFSVTTRVANEIIAGTGLNFEQFENKVAEKLQPQSQELTGKSVAFKTSVKSEIVKARNVLGIIEGEKKDEFIVVGGHYDHLGKWDGWIWNGADDNASGTVGVMTIAKAFMATGKKPEKSIIFAAWTAEEKGLYGSSYFVNQAKKQNMNVVLNLNYDMIARDEEGDSLKNMAEMTYTKANEGIEKLTRKNIDNYNINLNLSYRSAERPGGGSDHAPFAEVGIPIFYFMAAMHPDYHQPSDELDKVNWEKMLNIIRIGFLNTWELANSDEYLKIKAEPEKETNP
ncbi:MAG: M20/M25/M40 family metallo-hydrolase [Draconibacterium sp.]